jgi:hypothetical protein
MDLVRLRGRTSGRIKERVSGSSLRSDTLLRRTHRRSRVGTLRDRTLSMSSTFALHFHMTRRNNDGFRSLWALLGRHGLLLWGKLGLRLLGSLLAKMLSLGLLDWRVLARHSMHRSVGRSGVSRRIVLRDSRGMHSDGQWLQRWWGSGNRSSRFLNNESLLRLHSPVGPFHAFRSLLIPLNPLLRSLSGRSLLEHTLCLERSLHRLSRALSRCKLFEWPLQHCRWGTRLQHNRSSNSRNTTDDRLLLRSLRRNWRTKYRRHRSTAYTVSVNLHRIMRTKRLGNIVSLLRLRNRCRRRRNLLVSVNFTISFLGDILPFRVNAVDLTSVEVSNLQT